MAQYFKPPQSLTRLFPQVQRVVHAKKPVNVEVRPRDCAEGKKLMTNECALAKAAKRQFQADGVAIRLSDSYIVKGKTAIRFSTPETVKREIVSFDRHQDFASGIYRLSPAKPSWATPGKFAGKKRGKQGKHRPKIIHRTARVRTVYSEEA
jgi:hypothetical protein